MSHEPPANCDDPSTWHHRDQVIDLPTLLRLIEAHGGTDGLDLHGCRIVNADFSYQALMPELQQWRGTGQPPWVYGVWGIKLEGVHLEKAQVMTSNLRGADFTFAMLDGTRFRSVNLEKASFVQATMRGGSLMWCSARELAAQNAVMDGSSLINTDLERALFRGASLARVRLWESRLKDVDLRLTNLQGALLHGTQLDKTRVLRANFGHRVGEELAAKGRVAVYYPITFAAASDVYRDLKTNFQTIGHYEDAAWAYIKEKQMEKASYFPTSVGHRWLRYRVRRLIRRTRSRHPSDFRAVRFRLLYQLYSALLHSRLLVGWCPTPLKTAMHAYLDGAASGPVESASRWRWLRNWAYELLTGYGERAWMPVIWAFVVIAVFTAVYAIAGNIAPDFAGDPATAQASHSFLDALTHSIGAFATIGFNTLEPLGWGARLLTAIESALGISLFALFIFTLGHRMSRS